MAPTARRIGARGVIVLGVIAIVTARLVPAGALPAPEGSLDATFGANHDGRVVTDVEPAGRPDEANAVAVGPDGRIVAAGYAVPGSSNDIAVTRYDPDGSLDPGFGGGDGIVTTDVGTASADVGNAVAVESDGKIVVAGSTAGNGSSPDFAVARYGADGSLDPGFGGGDGIVTTDVGTASADVANAVAVQPDGKIVVAGSTSASGPGNTSDFAVVRYDPDGSLDPGFGGGDGIVTTDIGNGTDSANAVVVQPDGEIVAAGSGGNDFAVVRYNSDGTLDPGFGAGGGGIAVTDINGHVDVAHAVTLQADGRIVAAGETGPANQPDFAVARYNVDGTPDAGFGVNGVVTTDVEGVDSGRAVALQPNGRIIVAGTSSGIFINTDFAVVRYNLDGSLDSSFGGGGKSIASIGQSTDNARAVAVQADGNIVVAGSRVDSEGWAFALARFVGDATPPFGAHLVGLPADTTTLKPTVQWVADDDNSGIDTFDVRKRSAAFGDTSYGVWTDFKTATPYPAAAYTGSPGHTVCFDVRARDVAGNLGAYGPASCVAFPVDDPTATPQGSWTTNNNAKFYGGSARSSSTAGASLSMPVAYRHLGVVVEKCAGCGKVTIALGDTVVTINTAATSAKYRVIVPIDASLKVKTGTLTITQASAGKPVLIDGIAVNLG